MRLALRLAAVAIAIAGIIDPAIAGRVRAPLAIEVRTSSLSDPDFPRAAALRDQVLASLDDEVATDGASPPHVVIAIGNVPLADAPSAPVFAFALPPLPRSTSILEVRVPERTVPGQSAPVTAAIRARGLAGRTTSLTLELRGTVLAALDHAWTQDDERFEARLSFAPPAAGVHRVRVLARTAGVEAPAAADAIVVTREQRLRVLAYERRPSWPLTFVRRSLEGDALFDVASTSRTSLRAATSSAGGPRTLAALDVDRFDAIVVGALDALDESELGVLDRFVSQRGGTLVLVPDRGVPESLRRRFGISRTAETLLEKPVPLQGAPLRASEFLLVPEAEGAFEVLASARQGGVDRPVITAMPHGSGRIVFAGALDAWRYRAEESGGFARFWHGLLADAALASPPRIAVSLAPAIARQGDEVRVSVAVRGTEFGQLAGTITGPAVGAALAGTGEPEMIRLWPGTRPGSYEARLQAPKDGRYTVSASIEGVSADAPLLVAEDVVHQARDTSAALEHAARSTGGVVLSDPADLAPALALIETGTVRETKRPMRSSWWVAPFALLLCAEWALRRRSGLR